MRKVSELVSIVVNGNSFKPLAALTDPFVMGFVNQLIEERQVKPAVYPIYEIVCEYQESAMDK